MSLVQRALLGSGFLAIAANFFFFRSLGTPALATVIALCTVYLFFVSGKRKLEPTVTGLVLFQVLFLILAVVRATPIVQLLMLMSATGISATLAFLFASKISFFPSLRYVVFLPLALGGSYLVASVDQYISGNSPLLKLKNKTPWLSSTVVAIGVGLLIGIPVVIVLSFLLAQADPIFSKKLSDLFGKITISGFVWRLIGSAFVFVAALPAAFLSIKLSKHPEPLHLSSLRIPMAVVMTLVAMTLGAFLIIQWPYVFARVAAETDLSRFGVATYSEYVKKGFLEFVVVAGLVYSLLWGGLLARRGTSTTSARWLTAIQTLVIVLLYVFLFSVGRRIMLYWELHGLSLIRIYGGLSLLWVAYLTLLLWLRHFKSMRYVLVEVFGTLLLILGIGVWNAEQFIVFHHPPTVNGNVDYVYLSRLSVDGYDGWKSSYAAAKQIVQRLDIQEANVLDADQRRQVAYAGISIAMITRHYHDLILQYGTTAERLTYYQTLYTLESHSLKQTAQLFEQDLSVIEEEGDTANVVSQGYLSSSGTGEPLVQSINYFLPELKNDASVTASLASTVGTTGFEPVYTIEPRSPLSFTEFGQGTCGFYYGNDHYNVRRASSCAPSFYLLHQQSPPTSPHRLDQWWTWNAREAQVYAQLRHEIPLVDLVNTQNLYTALWIKVLHPQQTEKAVGMDISTVAPLIDSLW